MEDDLEIPLRDGGALTVGVDGDQVRVVYHFGGNPQWIADLTPLQALTLAGYLQYTAAKPFGAQRVSITVETGPKVKTP